MDTDNLGAFLCDRHWLSLRGYPAEEPRRELAQVPSPELYILDPYQVTTGVTGMKIYFCDSCNESIPLPDIKANRITIDAGKIYCPACAPKPPSKLFSVNIPTMLIAVLLSTVMGAVMMELFGDLLLGRERPDSVAQRLQNIEGSLVSHREKSDKFAKKTERSLNVAEDGHGVLKRLTDRVSGLAVRIESHTKEMSGLRESLRADQETLKAELTEEVARQSAAENQLPLLAEAQSDLEQQLGAVIARLDAVDGRLERTQKSVQALSRGGGLVARSSDGSGGAASSGGGDTAEKKKIDAALALLKHPDGPRRFTAVFELAQMKGRRVEEGLVGALKDEKSFVRQAAAERLGEVKARWTAEPLIQKLKDSDPFVREAVVSALESILGRSIGLVASADAATRIAKCRELEEWWKTNKDK